MPAAVRRAPALLIKAQARPSIGAVPDSGAVAWRQVFRDRVWVLMAFISALGRWVHQINGSQVSVNPDVFK